MIRIPEKEIRKRFQKLRNYENILYPQLKERSDRIRIENKILKSKVKKLEKENKLIEKLRLELEELRIMKFGKKRNANKKTNFIPNKEKNPKLKKTRSKESYRRPEPEPNQVTDNLRMEIDVCPECGEKLINKEEHVHYREDLKNIEQLLQTTKQIVKTIIQSGKCPKCGRKQLAMEIPKQKVIIGQNIRNMIVFLTVVQGQSYREVLRSLSHQYGIKLSSGELVNILEGESKLVTPYYNYLFETLANEPCHYDETTWQTRNMGKEISEGNYCWVKISVNTANRIIWFGKSRGKHVAEDLRGEKKNSIGVSDDYGSYKNLFDAHQLCWAHPLRKLRDLATGTTLEGKTKQVCKQTYKSFAQVYKQAEKIRKKLQNNINCDNKKTKLIKLFEILSIPNPYDPEKLKIMKETLRKRKDKYFTFFDYPDLPLDNNKAERAIRKIVTKRKKSLGSKSAKGANTLSILYSVVFSKLESNPEKNFFELYEQIIDFDAQ